MSKMIQVSEGCYVAADQVAEVKISQSSQTLMIKTKDGSHYSRAPEYRQSVYAALDALVIEIDSALTPAHL